MSASGILGILGLVSKTAVQIEFNGESELPSSWSRVLPSSLSNAGWAIANFPLLSHAAIRSRHWSPGAGSKLHLKIARGSGIAIMKNLWRFSIEIMRCPIWFRLLRETETLANLSSDSQVLVDPDPMLRMVSTVHYRYSGFQTLPRTFSSFGNSLLRAQNKKYQKIMLHEYTRKAPVLRMVSGDISVNSSGGGSFDLIACKHMTICWWWCIRGTHTTALSEKQWAPFANGILRCIGHCNYWMNILFENRVGQPAAATRENPFQALSPGTAKAHWARMIETVFRGCLWHMMAYGCRMIWLLHDCNLPTGDVSEDITIWWRMFQHDAFRFLFVCLCNISHWIRMVISSWHDMTVNGCKWSLL